MTTTMVLDKRVLSFHSYSIEFSQAENEETGNDGTLTKKVKDSSEVEPQNQIEIQDSDENLFQPIANSNSSQVADKRENNIVYQFLKRYGSMGDHVLGAYAKYEETGDYETYWKDLRNILAKCVINYAVQRSKQLVQADYLYYKKKILELFPLEKDAIDEYYTIVDSKNSRGKLYNYYEKDRKMGLKISTYEKIKTKKIVPVSDLTTLKALREVNSEAIELWNQLKIPRLQVIKKMPFAAMGETFPIIKCQQGYEILRQDFWTENADASVKFMTNWPIASAKIIKLAQRKLEKSRDIRVSDLLKDYNEKFNSDVQKMALFILTTLFNGSKLPYKKIDKFAVQNHFVEYKKIELANDVEDPSSIFLNTMKKSQEDLETICKNKSLYILPRVFIISADGADFQAYVIISPFIYYKMNSIIKAVDICYQLMRSSPYYEDFGNVCPQIWELLEKYVYKITDRANSRSAIREVIEGLDKEN